MKKFNVDKYRQHLNTSWLGSELIYKEEIGSTNTAMKKLAREEVGHGSVLLTDHQTAGRGQYNKSWMSEKNQNLTFTITLKPNSGDRLPLLTLSCALAIVRTIDSLGIKGCEIKWPNDILIKGKKAGGLLTESVFLGVKLERVLIGIGLNVNQKSFGPRLETEATSIFLETEEYQNREQILIRVLSEIEHLYTRWNQRDDQLCIDVNRRLIGFGEWLDVSMNGNVKENQFKFLGMNEKGECVMLNEDLNINTFAYEQIRVFPNR